MRVKQLFVDMDGVLADFETGFFEQFGRKKSNGGKGSQEDADWEAVRSVKDFYANLPPMPDMDTLWLYIYKYAPFILTGVPDAVPESSPNKRAWAHKALNYGRVITCPSKEKYRFCIPGDILIDDWTKYQDKWEKAGGIWITHTSAANTIAELKRLGL